MNELEKKIQEQFGAELMIHDSFNPFSSLFKIKFHPYFHVLLEVEKAPEVDCYLLTHSCRFVVGGGVCTIGDVICPVDTERELLGKIREVLEEHNKLSDLLNNLYGGQ